MGMATSGEGVSGVGVFAFLVRGLAGSVAAGVVFGAAVLRAVVVLAGAGEDGAAVSGRGFFRGRPRFFATVCSVDIGTVGER